MPDAPRRNIKLFLNGLGALATGTTLLVVLVAKFTAGAWLTAVLVPTLILLMVSIKRHYVRVRALTADPTPLRTTGLQKPIVVIPMARWDKLSEKAMRFGLMMSEDIKVVHVRGDEENKLLPAWESQVMVPIREGKLQEPELVNVESNYRTIISPLMDYVIGLQQQNPTRKVAVILPELVVGHWWENLLHNQRVQLLKLLLLLRGNQRIIVINIPWYL
jgi:hypothetical protein